MPTWKTQSDKALSMTVGWNAVSTGLQEGKRKAVYVSWEYLQAKNVLWKKTEENKWWERGHKSACEGVLASIFFLLPDSYATHTVCLGQENTRD